MFVCENSSKIWMTAVKRTYLSLKTKWVLARK